MERAEGKREGKEYILIYKDRLKLASDAACGILGPVLVLMMYNLLCITLKVQK